jgi:hypothetical protein
MITKKGWVERLRGLFTFRPTWSPSDFDSKTQGWLLTLKTGGTPFEEPKWGIQQQAEKVWNKASGVVSNASSQFFWGLSFLALVTSLFGFNPRPLGAYLGA